MLMSVPGFESTVSTLGFTRVLLVKDDESFEEWIYNELHNDEFTTIEFRFRLCLFEKVRRHKIGARFIVFKRL